MDSMTAIFIGIILGGALMYFLFKRFGQLRKKELTEHQSSVLLDKIKSVCKLVTIEGDFAEIYKYENTKNQFMDLLSSKKKALVVINAKAQIGYDLKKLLVHADNAKKRIILTNFPQPEVLSIQPELDFYDVQNGLFNSFTPEDLTNINKEAKKHIADKIPESGLMETARREAREAILLMESIVETIGWKLDYSALELPEEKQKELPKENKNAT